MLSAQPPLFDSSQLGIDAVGCAQNSIVKAVRTARSSA
jgi:hypothetical protein